MKLFHRMPGAGVFSFLFLLANLLTAQTTLHVPADFPKIQSAINAAQTGDTVLVSPGIYYENLQLQGRDIVLTSRYNFDSDPAATIRHTIVDGSQPAHPDTASCLLIWKGETAATVVQGFTFRGGTGTVWLDPAGAGTFREGGGILTEGSSPVIRHNVVRDNVIPSGGAGLVSTGGGGIRCGEGAVCIENNQIVHNRADGYGGGIVLNWCPGAVVKNNVIAFNYGGKDYSGGGFWATGQNQNTIVVLKNNTIAYNQTPAAAGQYGGKAGGIWVFSITVKVENNIVWGNIQPVGKPVALLGAALQLNHNLVETGFGGTATLNVDPMFRDTATFVLEAGSPAIDAGVPGETEFDFSKNHRRATFPARGNLQNDLGAYGGAYVANPACPPSFLSADIFSKVLNSPVVTSLGDSRSVNWIDIDNDHDIDLFISNGPDVGENNFLYKNNGTGGFAAVAGQPIVQDNAPSDGATWADFDNDGDVDCYVVNWYGVNNLFYKNKGDGTFDKVTTGTLVADGGHSETASWGDYDKDGNLDLYVTNSGGNKRNFLYHNNGNGTLTKVSTGAAVTDVGTSRSVNWTDFDLDGDLDLFVSNEGNENENLYRNDNGVLTKMTGGPLLTSGAATISSSWGDFDNDGYLDVFLANDQANDGLFRNTNGVFEKITGTPVVTSGGNSFGSQWADVDNDGDLDLFVTHAFWGGQWKNFLYINQGDGTFLRNITEVVTTDQGWSYGCAFGDFDRDGDLDLAVANCYNASQSDYLYENHSAENGNNWLMTHCIGTVSNYNAIGAKIWLYTTINGQKHTQLREVSAQSGYCGQNQLEAHFGLGAATAVDSLTVQWPTGIKEVYPTILPNQYVTLTEGQGITRVGEVAQPQPLVQVSPNPFSDSVTVTWEMVTNGNVQLEVSDALGKIIYQKKKTTASGRQEWVWTGRDSQGAKVPAGVYVLTLRGAKWQVSNRVIRE